ncbi:peptidoglycan editing factor PgeF [Falsibacillus pallidus]|uniref:Purine nucleoside phosphorylase n=1 Tax=Falsibacillus pallidus TaxID=493781 RepID=A0A370GV39_9BACI|nr:peptidoglycan editing factor PgeF [Falsibacillus pallidus]RDI47537.1 hypothetical protein DFR59_101195 [Falsibacillus pallidus]
MGEPFDRKFTEYFALSEWVSRFPDLAAGFTSKEGGFSKGSFESLNMGFHVGDELDKVVSNRILLAERLGTPIDDWVAAEQTHGNRIVKASLNDRGKGAKEYASGFKDTDGFYTNEPGILLTLAFADCVPLFFIAPEKGYIGVAHAGWKGTAKGIAAEMVKAWMEEGVSPEEIHAAIGPSICRNCYVVDDRVINEMEIWLDETVEKPYNEISQGQYSIDLKEMNKLILRKSGIPANHIEMTQFCTSCDSEYYFSHRRDEGKTGRMLSFIGWKGE